jgi:membrane protein implicated in regulation of membrane protease activity
MLSLSLLWLIAGSLLCLTEFIFPSAFVAFMMGISAILVAGVALVIPAFGLQVVLWLLFSTGLIFLSRRWLTPKHSRSQLRDAHEAETLTDIPAGGAGRVLYEGNSWRAICEDANTFIAPQQKVYVVRRQGNTLIVLPTHLLP